MAMDKREKEWLLYGGLGGGGLLLFLLFAKGGSTKGGKTTTNQAVQNDNQRTVTPNPQQASLDQAIVQARTQALTAFDSSKLGQVTTINTNETNKQIAFNTNQAQTTQARIQAAAEQAISGQQTQAEEEIAQEQQAEQSQQSSNNLFGGIFGSLLGTFGNIFPFLDFSQLNSSTPQNPFAWSNFWNSNPYSDQPYEDDTPSGGKYFY